MSNPAEMRDEDWTAYMKSVGYITPALVPSVGDQFSAGWVSAFRRFEADRNTLAAILAARDAWVRVETLRYAAQRSRALNVNSDGEPYEDDEFGHEETAIWLDAMASAEADRIERGI